ERRDLHQHGPRSRREPGRPDPLRREKPVMFMEGGLRPARRFSAALFIAATLGFAQTPEPSTQEQQDLMRAVNDGGTSPMDLIRTLEAFLAKYPASSQRPDIERRIGQAAIDSRDVPRIAKYGEKVLETSPKDLMFLDRVTYALIAIGGKENAD